MTMIIDTEDAIAEKFFVKNEAVTLVLEDGVYNYIWLHDRYQVRGQSNLSSGEIIDILDNLKFTE